MRTLVIGDVHGCLEELRGLVERLEVAPEDRLVLLGDLVDRGPDSPGVVRYVRELAETMGDQLVLILGNHEDKHLRYRRHALLAPGDENPVRLSAEEVQVHHEVAPEDWEWLQQRSLLYWRDGTLLVTHAGTWSDSESLPDDPAEVAHWPGKRRRKLLSYLLHVRQVTSTGKFVALGQEGADSHFWGDVYDGRFGFVAHGHSASRGQVRRCQYSIGLDTGCVYGHQLTAGAWVGTVQEHRGPDELISFPAQRAYAQHLHGAGA